MPRPRSIHGPAGPLSLAVCILAACGEVGVTPDDDGGTPGSRIDARIPGPDIDGSVDAREEPGPDAPPPQCNDGLTQLLYNPGFEEANEQGAIGWVEEAAAGDHLTFPEDQLGAFTVYEGNRAAWMGRPIPSDQRLKQRFAVPPSTTALEVVIYRCFVTEEADSMTVFDTLTISLLDDNGSPVEELATFTNLDVEGTCSWGEVKFDASASHAGEELQLEFHVVTDNGSGTSFFLDAIAVDAFGPCPDAS